MYLTRSFLLLITLVQSTPSLAAFNYGTLAVRQNVYKALDILQTERMDRLEVAINHIQLARDLPTYEPIKDLLGQAATILGNQLGKDAELADEWEGGTVHIKDNEVKQAIKLATAKLKNVLVKSRLRLNRRYPKEADLVEAMIRAHLNPADPNKVSINFANLDRTVGLGALATYLADPKSAQYDPLVAQLVRGRPVEVPLNDPLRTPGMPRPDSNVFVSMQTELFTQEDLALIPNPTAYVDEMRVVIAENTPPELPVNTEIKVINNKFMLQLEVRGFDAAPGVFKFAQKATAVLGPNRYLGHLADALQKLSIQLQTGQIPLFKGMAERAAKVIDKMKDGLRFGSKPFMRPTVKTIKSMITKRDGGMEAAKKTHSAIDKAIEILKGTDEYKALTTAEQQAARVKAAERAAGVKAPKIDTVLKVLTFGLAAYYMYAGAVQSVRAQDPEEKAFIQQKYGVKTINTLAYAVPVLGEAAIAIDVLAFVFNNTLLDYLNIRAGIPTVEEMLHGFINSTDHLAYWWVGTSQFEVMTTGLEKTLQIKHIMNLRGRYMDKPLFNLAMGETQDIGANLGINEEIELTVREQFELHVKIKMAKYIQMIYIMQHALGDARGRKFGLWEQELHEKLFLAPGSYFNESTRIIQPKLELIPEAS